MTNGRWSWDAVLSGVVPPMISPLGGDGEPDEVAIEKVVEHILAGGCTGLFVLGGCGEGAYLSALQRATVIRTSVRAARGRVAVLAGIMLPGTAPALDAARVAADEGADALVAGSPYYYAASGDTQRRHIERILDASPLPVLLYNIPQATHYPLAPSVVGELSHEPRVLGIKDSAGDFSAFLQILRIKEERPDFRVLQGNESLAAASLLHGGDGLVPGMANFVPELFVELREAARTADVGECRRLQARIEAIGALHTHGHWLPALKAACAMVGLGNGLPSPPLAAAGDGDRAAIRAILLDQNVLPA